MKFKTFCAANSGDGFISFFDTILDEKKHRIYYIKGGPGCGKSTLMKAIADRSEDAELIHCSGDPDSLDGVILPKQNAVIIDATNPHSFEPKYPGICGNIIDLGEGWEPKKLNKEKIIELSDQKGEIYRSSYSLLRSAKEIHTGIFKPLIKHIQMEKIQKISDKILLQNALWEPKKHTAKIKKRFLSAISPNGLLTLTDPIQKLGKNVILIDDRWMVADYLLSHIDQQLLKRGIDHINSYHPLLGKQTIQHIIIPQSNISILTKDSIFNLDINNDQIIRKINLQTIINKDFLDSNKNKFTFFKRLQKEILQLATEKLETAREIHLKIEQEYAKGIDFHATEHLRKNLMIKLFS